MITANFGGQIFIMCNAVEDLIQFILQKHKELVNQYFARIPTISGKIILLYVVGS